MQCTSYKGGRNSAQKLEAWITADAQLLRRKLRKEMDALDCEGLEAGNREDVILAADVFILCKSGENAMLEGLTPTGY